MLIHCSAFTLGPSLIHITRAVQVVLSVVTLGPLMATMTTNSRNYQSRQFALSPADVMMNNRDFRDLNQNSLGRVRRSQYLMAEKLQDLLAMGAKTSAKTCLSPDTFTCLSPGIMLNCTAGGH